jgi:hypothetical protein
LGLLSGSQDLECPVSRAARTAGTAAAGVDFPAKKLFRINAYFFVLIALGIRHEEGFDQD